MIQDFPINSRVKVNLSDGIEFGKVIKNRRNTILVELDSGNPIFTWKRNVCTF